MPKYYLGIDQGTTGTTALLMNENWDIAGRGYKEQKQYFPKQGWVEQDPMEIYENVLSAVKVAVSSSQAYMHNICCIGIDNQGETVMMWDKQSGQPVYPAIVWQDTRTAKEASRIKAVHESIIRKKTGLIINTYFSATKIRWLIDNVADVKDKIAKGNIQVGTLDTWLIWKLTNGKVCATDQSTASRTMLFNIHTKTWDDELLDIFGIQRNLLPEIHDSAYVYGNTDPKEFFGISIPISGNIVDQQAALLGQNCLIPGTIKTTYGTGCFMLMNTGNQPIISPNGLLTTVGWGLNNNQLTFVLEAGIYIAGAAIQWLRSGLGIIKTVAESDRLAKSVMDTEGLYFVPAFSGLATPYWNQNARGTIVGITGGIKKEHIVRATLESIAYQVKDNLDLMEAESGIQTKVMRVDGGITANDFLMQFQADILGIPVDVPVINEATALGAAYLAAIGVGEINDFESLKSSWRLKKRYEPRIDTSKRDMLLHQWHRAVERSKNWIE